MRTVRTKVYKFNELNEAAKERAIEQYRNSEPIDFDWCWEQTKEDAEQIGLSIKSLDDHKPNKGEFEISAADTAQRIIENHGDECETYKTAKEFLTQLEAFQVVELDEE